MFNIIYILLFSLVQRVSTIRYEVDLIKPTLRVLQLVSNYYEKNYEEVNMDSIFGLRSAEGTLYDLLQNSLHLNDDFTERISSIHSSIHRTAEQAYQQSLHDPYNVAFSRLINTKWFYQLPLRATETVEAKLHQVKVKYDLNEGVSDECMKALLGTQIVDGALLPKCSVERKCANLMLLENTKGYYLTHQSLYLMLADVIGCSSNVTYSLGVNIYDRIRALGSRVREQSEEIKLAGFPLPERDLFLEQLVICKWSGVQDCYSGDVLREIFTWQDPSGCVKDKSVTTRKLLSELVMPDGCLSHTTGLLIATYASHLHWLLVDPSNDPRPTLDISFRPNFIETCIVMLPTLIVVFVCLRKWRPTFFRFR